MMKRVLAFVTALVLATAVVATAAGSEPAAGGGQAEQAPALLFVLTGQSNAGQQGKPGQVAAAAVAPVAGAWYRAPQHTKVQGIVAMQPWRGAFGAELSFARAVRAACPGREVVVAKVYAGGTSIVAWSPDAPNSVFPTCVGVNRKCRRPGPLPARIPHVRGGEPLFWARRRSSSPYSPRAWG